MGYSCACQWASYVYSVFGWFEYLVHLGRIGIKGKEGRKQGRREARNEGRKDSVGWIGACLWT